MTIRCIYEAEPPFPAMDQHPEAKRYRVGAHWVDAVDGEPTEAEVREILVSSRVAAPEEKLAMFLSDNPDVRSLVESNLDNRK